MKREVLTRVLPEDQLRKELQHFVEFYSAQGVNACNALFGFAWGNYYYPDDKWEWEEVALDSLIAKVEQVEAAGLGTLGCHDLWLKLTGLEFLFCHESDIHLSFIEHRTDVEHFFERWKKLGFTPSERSRNEPDGPSEKAGDA